MCPVVSHQDESTYMYLITYSNHSKAEQGWC